MDTHQNAPLTPRGREMMVRAVVDRGLSKAAVARQFNTTPKTVAKWVDRFQAEGVEGLQDRSSRPLSLPSQTAPAICAAVEALRRQRHTAKQIAVEVGVSAATVSRILRRLGLNRLSALEPAEPIRRYERANPGELIHIDIKKLGRIGSVGHRMTGRKTGAINRHLGIGWEFVHVCIDDASRIAFSQVMKDERKSSAVAFLEAAVAHYASLGVKMERVMSEQWILLRLASLSPSLPEARSQTHQDQALYPPEPMARRNASFRPVCANGPMHRPITVQTNAQPNCPDGSIATIGIGP